MNQLNQNDHDTIQLFEPAVQHLLPTYADEDDMYEALSRCGLTQQQIFDELDRRLDAQTQSMLSVPELANHIQAILFDAFDEAIEDATAHKAPLQ